ncbi:DegT/DnrJ/EryC1/StrS family aminotransferase [Cellvibrio sp.]|uniref:DegT/DnrJ/EryC1/StrS family aminotransferase n=1 Tax=Cellvibrio sp. TaxID=1965322 RepID=UPI0039647FFB
MEFIDLKAQYAHLKDKIDARIRKVLDHGNYIMGPEVQELEEQLADYVGVNHCISCANGTDALQLALMAFNIGEGDAVFVPTFTFFATAEVVAYAKATPIFIDSDERTFNIDPAKLEAAILKIIKEKRLKPKAIIAVDLFGLPANYPEIEAIAAKYNLKLIEDSAQGFGGSINGKRAGGFGDIATTSFFPAKPLGCYGDGGAIFTNSDEIADLIRSFRVHGKGIDKYDNIRIGVNSRLDTIQAAILLEKLAVFPQELNSRNELAAKYNASLKDRFVTPYVPEGYVSSWAQYTVISDNRDAAMATFKEQGVPTMVYYRTCMHQQTAFADLGCRDTDFPVASRLAKQVFSLPMHGYMK